MNNSFDDWCIFINSKYGKLLILLTRGKIELLNVVLILDDLENSQLLTYFGIVRVSILDTITGDSSISHVWVEHFVLSSYWTWLIQPACKLRSGLGRTYRFNFMTTWTFDSTWITSILIIYQIIDSLWFPKITNSL